MTQNIFYPALNEFCRRYLIGGTPVPDLDRMLFETRLKEQRDALFEQFLLFDRISFKVFGENILVPVLLGFFGERGLDALIDQGAIGFVLWTPGVVFLEENIPGVDAIAAMSHTSPPHSDPEQSIELGLNWMTRPLPAGRRRRLIRKLLPLYSVPSGDSGTHKTALVKAAFLSGRLLHYGLNPATMALDALTTDDKRKLARCCEELIEYIFILDNNMTSFSEYSYFSPFWDTAKRFRNIQQIQTGFRQIAAIEGFPDLKAVAGHIEKPLLSLPKLRQSRNAARFRRWLETTVDQSVETGFTKLYIDSIANRRGVFDSAPAKFVKAIALTSAGVGVGHILGGVQGAAIGAGLGGVSAGVMEIAGHFGLDLLDAFALEAVSRGWAPRMFFDDLARLRREKEVAEAGGR